jgi:diguanylate cyclase (GGDEF)-like protein
VLDPVGDPVLTRLLAGTRAVTGADPAAGGALAELLGPDAGRWLAVPLAVRAEQRGLLLAGRGQPFSEAEIEIIAALASQGVTALDNALLFRQVRELAAYDGLTQLFNRRHFHEVAEPLLAASRRDRRQVAAIMVDIDRFKAVNDTHGHGVGDEVIRVVGDRLSRALRQGDLLCRYGGEEFAALLTDVSTEQASAVARRLNEVIRDAPVDTAAGPLRVTVSVGLAGPVPSPDDLPELLEHADTALYRAKREGRDRVIRTG